MSQKIHIGKNGPAPCHASKRPCTLGQHYESLEEADKAFDAQQSSESNSFKGFSKKTTVNNEESIMTVSKSGTKSWRNKNGELHRVNGPAKEYYEGTKEWYQNGKLHRTDGPAIESANGYKEYWVNGKRLDEKEFNQQYGKTDNKKAQQSSENNTLKGVSKKTPVKKGESTMTVNRDGTKNWRNKKGELHRVDGPALEFAGGTKMWCQENKLHRTDGPAVEKSNGDKEWYQNGKYHRVDGPALEWSDGSKEYWVDGQELSEKEFNQKYDTH